MSQMPRGLLLAFWFLFNLTFAHQGHDHGAHECSHSHSDPVPAHWNAMLIKLINEYASSFRCSPKLFGALASTLVVGVVPIFFLYLLPITKKVNGATVVNHTLMKILLAFAVGGLLGDAFLHLIPHALSPHEHKQEQDHHDHSHSYDRGHDHGHSHDHDHSHIHASHDHTQQTMLGVYILGGIFVFFLVEKIITLLGGQNHSHNHQQPQKQHPNERVKTSALLNVIADFIHNFTDGMAIAASYSASLPVGIATTVAVFIHEIPHEIGDMAILITSGVTFPKVVLIQLGTAVGAILGTIFGFFVTASLSDAILPMTAGGFIYIALVSVLPQLFENTNMVQTILESAAMIAGGAVMYGIALYE